MKSFQLKETDMIRRTVALVMFALLLPFGTAVAAEKETAKIDLSVTVLEQLMTIPEKAIPPELLGNAYGIAIIPEVIKVGLVLGGRYGTGVVLVKDEAGQWSNPVFITLTGGSIGWQIGAESTDVVLIFKNKRSVEGLMQGKFTLGVDAGVAAGPVGRRVEGATDAQLKAEIYSYSRSRGIFAGISLEGSALQIDNDANAAFYGRQGIGAGELLAGRDVPAPKAAERLQLTLDKYAGGKRQP
jgi:lipid-binding SYLF domain-containing protein